MARAPSPVEFLAVTEKSKLLHPVALEPYRGALDRYATADELAAAMTAEGLLTKFQADHLRRGKWQGFFLGTYKMLEKIGSGGSAVVYLAEHVRLKQRVAIKVLSHQKAADAEALGRFEREAKAAAAVRHPNIVHAFDVATEGRVHYMVMEYVNGVTLVKALTDGGRMAPRRVARLMRQAALGLHAAHQAGIVHRDVKPSNLMIATDDAVKVMDLGLARYDADDSTLTQGKAVLGLAAYTAPEQMRENATVDARTDVYALGATFYLVAAGMPPPVVGVPAPALAARAAAEAGDFRKLMSVVERMMAVRPEDRYQSMADVAAALSVSGLLAEPKAKAAARPAVSDPSETAEVAAVAETPKPADDTPSPKRTQPVSAASDTAEVAPYSLEDRMRGLFAAIGHVAPTPEPQVERELPPAALPRQHPTRQWVAAGATFAIVLALLFILVR